MDRTNETPLSDGRYTYVLVREEETLPGGIINVALYERIPVDVNYQYTTNRAWTLGQTDTLAMMPLARGDAPVPNEDDLLRFEPSAHIDEPAPASTPLSDIFTLPVLSPVGQASSADNSIITPHPNVQSNLSLSSDDASGQSLPGSQTGGGSAQLGFIGLALLLLLAYD